MHGCSHLGMLWLAALGVAMYSIVRLRNHAKTARLVQKNGTKLFRLLVREL